MSEDLYTPRVRSSVAGTFSVRGPSILEESQEAPLTVILNTPPGMDVQVNLQAPGALRLLKNGSAAKQLDLTVPGGGNTVVFVKAGNRPVASDGVKYAYPSTLAVLVRARGDSAVVALCIRRSVPAVLLATIGASSSLMKAATGSAVALAIGGLLAFFLAADSAVKVVGGAIAIAILLTFTLWFVVSTLRRIAKVQEVIGQNVSAEGGQHA